MSFNSSPLAYWIGLWSGMGWGGMSSYVSDLGVAFCVAISKASIGRTVTS